MERPTSSNVAAGGGASGFNFQLSTFNFLRPFGRFLVAASGVMLQYRGEILLWSVWGLVSPAVLYAVWTAAADSSESGRIAGMGPRELAAYYLLVMIIGHLCTAWDTYEMGYLVRTGRMSSKLLRPILPIWEALADNLAYKIVAMVFTVPMWLLFAWWIRPAFATTVWDLAAGILAVGLGMLLNFLLCYTVALIAFWTPKLDAIGEIYFAAVVYFGGWFAPLDTLPPALRTIADVLPFRWVYAFPIELLIGRMQDRQAVATAFVMQIAWLAVAVIAFRVLWRAAVKRYTAVSG